MSATGSRICEAQKGRLGFCVERRHSSYRHLVVASRGGAPDHPQWYKNLVAQPEVEVQVLGDRFRARTHTATQEEKLPLWRIMADIWPSYIEYQTRTMRDIPVVIIERI